MKNRSSLRTPLLATVASALILVMLYAIAGALRNGMRQTGWITYTSPEHRYTFVHPSSWTVTEQHRGGDMADVYIHIPYKGSMYTARVLRQGRGAPVADEVRRTHSTYQVGPATHDVYIRDGRPVEEVIFLDHARAGDPFVGIDVMLPDHDQEQFSAQINQLMMSMHLL